MITHVSSKIPLVNPKGSTVAVITHLKGTTLACTLRRGAHYKTVVGYDLDGNSRYRLANALVDWVFLPDQFPPDDAGWVMVAVIGAPYSRQIPILLGEVQYDVATKDWLMRDGAPVEGTVFAWAVQPIPPAPREGGAK